MTAETFQERFLDLSIKRSSLCVGIDPSPLALAGWGLKDDAQSLAVFCDAILDAASPYVAVVKPQAAFFERHGWQGLRELKRVTERAKGLGALVIIDAKRGDISTSAVAYGEAYLGSESPFGADAITLNPYLGFDALRPLLEVAKTRRAGVFVVVRSSNPEGEDLQHAKCADGRTVAEQLADKISEYNASMGRGVGLVGAVVGATLGGEALTFAERLPQSLILAPGFGSQGARLEDAKRIFGDHYVRVLPSVSRNIADVGPSPDELKQKVRLFSSLAQSKSPR